jgi:PAS domain S-box-containing protein
MTANQDLLTRSADILVVDDEIASLRLLTQLLTGAGYQVRSAEKPGLAIESALAYPPDLILLDVMMPEMDGFEVCQRLREHERICDIPIIFISALGDVEHKVRGFEVGGVDFISKPIEESEVLARLKTHLQLREMQLNLEALVSERTNELLQANEALRTEIVERQQVEEERDRILNMSQELICIAGMDGYFKYLNPAWESTLGYTQEELFTRPFLNFIHPDDHARNEDEVEKLSAGQPTRDFQNRYIHKNGSIRTISWSATPLPEEQVTYCIGRDITERVQARQALHDSEEKYRTLVEQANDGIAVIQGEKIVFANKRLAQITGRTFIDILDTPFTKYIPADDLPIIVDMYQRREYEETPSIFESAIQHKDGSRVEVELSAGLTTYAKKPAILVIIRDNTERVKAYQQIQEYQERLKALASQLTIVEERERRRIAAELHDHIGQSLAFARMQLAAARNPSSEEERDSLLEETSKILLETIQAIRGLVFDLSSPLLSEIGLGAAISDYLEKEIEGRHGINTLFSEGDMEAPISEDMRAILFRNVRELLNNVVRHANASLVSVRMQQDGAWTKLIVEDNGVGFDPESASQGVSREGAFGLFSIQERMSDLDGSLEIISQPGQGTQAILLAPNS